MPIPDRAGIVLITATGPIIPGDTNRLMRLIGRFPPNERILALALDSPGGNLAEAVRLATLIRGARSTVAVFSGRKCVSACFLLFAAGSKRFVEADALVGVHSASQAGHQTAGSLAATAAMARDAGALGAPPAIVGKMVEATPNQMEWLTPDDLASMGVKVLPPETASPAVAETTPPSDAPAQGDAVASKPATDTPSQEPPAFQQGLADRRGWEQWFSALTGDRQIGAGFWAAHRSDPKLPSCYGVHSQYLGDW
ncbi:MAG TPA: hypothetical protein VFW75_14180, partial [Acetobacteraceae bacterium]|nr:hypothetical protein [Acetobacteraceae bacterium]